MKVFMIEWSQHYHVRVAERLAQAGIEVLYWTGGGRVGRRDGIDLGKIRALHPNAITQTTLDAIRAVPANGLGSDALPAPGKRLLRALFEAESHVLTMMDRIAYPDISLEARKEHYYKLVRHWSAALDRLQPDCVVNTLIPHMVYDYVLYELCRLRGVMHLCFDYTRVPGRMVMVDDFQVGHPELRRSLSQRRGLPSSMDALPEDIRRYALRQLDQAHHVTPFDVRRYLSDEGEQLISPWRRLARHRRERGLWFALRYEVAELRSAPPILSLEPVGRVQYRLMQRRWERTKARLRREYDSLARPPDTDRPFVYVALHFQPECTTSPQGGVFVNQRWMVEILGQSVPSGWVVYVKEHPRQLYRGGSHSQQCRRPGYYRALAALPNVQLVPRQWPGLELVRSARAVASVGGTTGVEAVFNGVPALTFGYPYYLDMPGVYHVGDIDECRAVLDRVAAGDVSISTQDILGYLAVLAENSTRGYVETLLERPSGIRREEAADLIAAAIVGRLSHATARAGSI